MNNRNQRTTFVIAFILSFFATTALADVPPPPVNQVVGTRDTVYNNLTEPECLACHANSTHATSTSGCLACHNQQEGEGTVHHRNPAVSCTGCHALVADPLDGHYIPNYAVSVITPYSGMGTGVNGQGGCRYCHNVGTDSATGTEVSANLHHSAVGMDPTTCLQCHLSVANGYSGPEEIRICERCHSVSSLHNIQTDSNGDGVIIQGELPGYGHVGHGDDCMGCHGYNRSPVTIGALPDGGNYATPLPVTLSSNGLLAGETLRYAWSDNGTEPDVVVNGLPYTETVLFAAQPDHTASFILVFDALDGTGAALTPIYRKEYHLGHPPAPQAASMTLREGGSASIQLVAADLDTDESNFVFGISAPLGCGQVSLTTSGILTMTAPVGCIENGTLSYTVQDPLGLVGTATLSYNILPLQGEVRITNTGNGSGTVTSTPAGISCGTDCSETFNYGTLVTLVAAPATGSTFTGWSGDADCADGSVTVQGNASCTATFTLNTYVLTVSKAGTGSGTVTSTPAGISCGADCSESYNYGTVVTLTAASATGSFFAGWSGGGCSGTQPCTVAVNSNLSVISTFTQHIRVTIPNGGETWLRNQTYAIRWNYAGNPGTYVKIELLKNGVLNRTITNRTSVGTGGAGSYNWRVPNQTLGNDYRIRVTSTTNATYTDSSDANFTISR